MLDYGRDLWSEQDEAERAENHDHVYEAFAKRKVSLKSRGKGGKTATAGEIETYNARDTVLAQTWMVAARRVPSAAVIADM